MTQEGEIVATTLAWAGVILFSVIALASAYIKVSTNIEVERITEGDDEWHMSE